MVLCGRIFIMNKNGKKSAAYLAVVAILAFTSILPTSINAEGELTAQWKFDEVVPGQGEDFVTPDFIGSNDGTLVGSPIPVLSTTVPSVSFENTGSLEFNGSNYVQVIRPATDSFTICAWIKTTSSGGGQNHWESAPIMDSETGGIDFDFGFGVPC